jgi:hypothetical protein
MRCLLQWYTWHAPSLQVVHLLLVLRIHVCSPAPGLVCQQLLHTNSAAAGWPDALLGHDDHVSVFGIVSCTVCMLGQHHVDVDGLCSAFSEQTRSIDTEVYASAGCSVCGCLAVKCRRISVLPALRLRNTEHTEE